MKAKGYDRADFEDAFARYPQPPQPDLGGSEPLHRYNVENDGFIPPASRYTARYEDAAEPLHAT